MNQLNSSHKRSALLNQIKIVMQSYFPEHMEKERFFWFRCNVCGDSKKSKRKKRGYILKYETNIKFYCHNCGKSMMADEWLKQYFPVNYRSYLNDIIGYKNYNETNVKEENTNKNKNELIEIEKHNTKFFVPILKGNTDIFNTAINLCETRLIDKNIWMKWFVAIGGVYKNRLIIPYYDNNGKIYNYQGRKLYDWMEPKYLSRVGINLNAKYNYYLIDKDKPVIVTEGVIDSLFINNCIAVTGLRVNDKDLRGYYFLLDNDESGKNKSIKLIKRGEKVFLWKKFLQDYKLSKTPKDVNDVIIIMNKNDKFKFEDLQQYFSKSIYDKVYLI